MNITTTISTFTLRQAQKLTRPLRYRIGRRYMKAAMEAFDNNPDPAASLHFDAPLLPKTRTVVKVGIAGVASAIVFHNP